LKGKGVQVAWTFFKEEVLKAQEQAVPMCHKTNSQGREVAWLSSEILLRLRLQKSATFGRRGRQLKNGTGISLGHAERKLGKRKPI